MGEFNDTIAPLVVDVFAVIGTLITEFVSLLRGQLLILIIVGAFIGMIVTVIGLFIAYIGGFFKTSLPKMRK